MSAAAPSPWARSSIVRGAPPVRIDATAIRKGKAGDQYPWTKEWRSPARSRPARSR